jgi:hypothetical protein
LYTLQLQNLPSYGSGIQSTAFEPDHGECIPASAAP